MPDINPSLPVVGQPDATEEPKIITALQALVAAVNDVDSANLADLAVTTAKIAANAVTAAKIEAQQAWQSIAFTRASWTALSLNYFKDSLGVVRFRGDGIMAPTAVAAGDTLLTLPAGYRPGVKQYFPLLRVDSANTNAVASVDTAGVVKAETAIPTVGQTYSFAGLTFRAEG